MSATRAQKVYRIRQRASGIFTDLNETARLVRRFPRRPAPGTRRRFLSQMRGDIGGGAVSALMTVPYGMALSLAIGLSPEAGLYTSIIGNVITGFLSSSPVMISGLSATAVPVLAVVVKNYGIGAALAVGLMTGLVMTLVGILRIGRFANYLPPSIVSAFTCGLGVVICATQLKVVFGVTPAAMNFDMGIVDDIAGVVLSLGSANPQAMAVAGVVAVTMALLPRWKEEIPSSLVGVVLASIAALMFGFSASQRVGALPSGFPELRGLDFDFSQFSSLIHPALTLAGLFTINQVLTGIVVCRAENRCGSSADGSRDLIGQGVANVVTPFFGSPPGVAMLARTVASARTGATTRLSVYTHSFVLLLLVIPFRGLIGQIPLSALAAVTVMVGFQLIDWKRIRSLHLMNRTDLALFLLTFSLVVFADLIVGVGVGFLVAMLLFIERSASSTHLEEVPSAEAESNNILPKEALANNQDPTLAGVQTYRLIGPLFFASSERILKQLEKEVTAKMLVLDLSAAGLVDSAATDFLQKVFRLQTARGGDLFLIGLGKQHLFIFERGGLLNELGAHRFNFTANGGGASSYDENRATLVNTF